MTNKATPTKKLSSSKRAGPLTALEVSALKPGEWAADPTARGAGRLQVRRLAKGGLAWYYRYTTPRGERDRYPLGTGLTLAKARQLANDLSRRYQSGDRDLRSVLEAETREHERRSEVERRVAEAKKAKAAATLGALLTAYVDQLMRDEKPSASLVKGTIQRHVEKPWPQLWGTPAADVTMDDLLAVVARVVDQGTLREAAKLRSYLRAAYAAAIRARQSAQGLQALRELNLSYNPARELVTIEGASRIRDRVLSLAELRAYWGRISAMAGNGGAALCFHLLTGGQRIKQLARLRII